MSITCKICNEIFEKIIPWQHLKTHNIDSKTYKKNYGSLYSESTLEKLKTKVPHNKGKKVTDQSVLTNIRKGIEQRESKYRSGELTKHKTVLSQEQKNTISQKITEYAKLNPEKMKARTQKALETKRKNGTLINYNTGPVSDETKAKISAALKNCISKKTVSSIENIKKYLEESNLDLLTDIRKKNYTVRCNTCENIFDITRQYFTNSKFKKEICRNCYPFVKSISNKENELYMFIKELDPTAVQSYRKKYQSREIDIFLPELNLGFEFNGLYWHSEKLLTSLGRNPKSDFQKKLFFTEQNINLIQIFEDEWDNKKDIVKSRIRNILKKTPRKIYARECQIKELNSKQAGVFFEKTHIMGNGRSNVRLGLFYKNELVSAMSFTNNNISRKLNSWEINRFSSLLDTNVIGGASKLFKAFVKEYQPEKIISYADNRWSNGDLYKNLGFNKTSDGTPNYWYFLPNSNLRIHRFTLRKTKDDDQLLTEYENRLNQGYNRIWDSGSSRWEWTGIQPVHSS